MLREIKMGPDPNRRWFQNSNMDLFIWSTVSGESNRFELTYDKPHHEKSLIWTSPSHFTHCELDDGAGSGQHPSTPIHRSDIPCDVDYLLNAFARHSAGIDPDVIALVANKITEYGSTRTVAEQPKPLMPQRRKLLVSVAIVFLISAIIYWVAK